MACPAGVALTMGKPLWRVLRSILRTSAREGCSPSTVTGDAMALPMATRSRSLHEGDNLLSCPLSPMVGSALADSCN